MRQNQMLDFSMTLEEMMLAQAALQTALTTCAPGCRSECCTLRRNIRRRLIKEVKYWIEYRENLEAEARKQVLKSTKKPATVGSVPRVR